MACLIRGRKGIPEKNAENVLTLRICRKDSLSLLNALLEKKNDDNVLTWCSNCAGCQVRAFFLATFPLRAEKCFRKKKKRSQSTSSEENSWNAHPVKKKCMNCVCLLRCPLESVALVSGRPEATVKEALAALPGTMPYS